MSKEKEQQLFKLIAKVLNYKKVHMTELTTKRGSQCLYNDLISNGFQVKGFARPEWSFIKVFQVMFQDQNHMPDKVNVDKQLILDILAFCFREGIRILEQGINYCERAVILGGEAVIYGNPPQRPKTLKFSLFKLLSPGIYNDSSAEEIATIAMEKVFPKIPYEFMPNENIASVLVEALQQIKNILPKLEDPKDLLEVCDAFLFRLGQKGVRIIKTNS
ncbi:MAG: hypothetical protein D6805_04545 [Planctomycetota bacterium]|nr:MAG: hypothetical protein D6805_04545 [Planctomycetota bacterium]